MRTLCLFNIFFFTNGKFWPSSFPFLVEGYGDSFSRVLCICHILRGGLHKAQSEPVRVTLFTVYFFEHLTLRTYSNLFLVAFYVGEICRNEIFSQCERWYLFSAYSLGSRTQKIQHFTCYPQNQIQLEVKRCVILFTTIWNFAFVPCKRPLS